ncbi:hypothetical protein ILYODFUR_020050 [Ilyodon furcidens]|uniref:Uncharacterized protein n=1 Tax=Ilyodon furcidens TaxID=33524 RepID=A0ABV0V4J1_9TELE
MYATLCTLSSSYSSLLPFAHVEELIVILLHDSLLRHLSETKDFPSAHFGHTQLCEHCRVGHLVRTGCL